MMLKEIKNINDLAKAASLLKNEPLCMAHEYAIGNHGVVISISKTSIGEPASFGIGFPKTEGCAYTATLRKVRKMCRKLYTGAGHFDRNPPRAARIFPLLKNAGCY